MHLRNSFVHVLCIIQVPSETTSNGDDSVSQSDTQSEDKVSVKSQNGTIAGSGEETATSPDEPDAAGAAADTAENNKDSPPEQDSSPEDIATSILDGIVDAVVGEKPVDGATTEQAAAAAAPPASLPQSPQSPQEWNKSSPQGKGVMLF